VFASRADIRRFRALMNITAIGTMPFNSGLFLEDFSLGYIVQQFAISLLMEFLDFSVL
jgi:hypothetical protein